ncbi:MAG: T9SS type A sorting domain-containing protein [Hymenobacteraceae bacterium]|nr:T9SS type A sorting domain-containing protein [Hymenobacteraceae bacterium]
MEGPFLPAERDFRVELSNALGRFRRGQITTIGRRAASPITTTLPANLPLGTRYRLRVVRADGSVLGADNGQDLTIQRPTGTNPDAAVLAAPRLFPNPAQHAVTVAFADGPRAGRTVRLLDLTGRTVLLAAAGGGEARVSLLGVGAGCYLLQVRTPNGGQQTQRLIVQP